MAVRQLPSTDREEIPMLRIEHPAPNVLCLSGELDLESYEQLIGTLLAFPGPLTLDMSGVTFMDSTGLRAILKRRQDGPVTLVAPSVQIVRTLAICGLSRLRGLTVENLVVDTLMDEVPGKEGGLA
jgi:anti-anti-sigma factor